MSTINTGDSADRRTEGSLHRDGSADWSPMLRTSELQFSLYSDGTFEIRDGGAVYVHLTEDETSQMLEWLDGRNPPNAEVRDPAT